MGLQKYRADIQSTQSDGATLYQAQWIGGPTLSKIMNCRLDSIVGDMRVTAYTTGEADTAFTIPATCSLFGKIIRGYITNDNNGNLVFRHIYK